MNATSGRGDARVLGRQTADRRPVEPLAAMSEEGEEPVVQQIGNGHWHAQVLRCLQRESNIFVSKGCSKARWLEFSTRDHSTIGFVERKVEEAGGQNLKIVL